MATSTRILQQTGTTDQARQQDEMRELTGGQILCEALIHEGVAVMYGYPGGATMSFYDALTAYPRLHHVLVRHEQAAVHAADGYARATGKVGVCVTTSGPGAMNLVTGLATAWMDSTPIVAITGQVARHLIGSGAFQEIDVIGVTQPITKHNFQVRSTHEIAQVIHEAFHIARSGRPGPVLVDIPKDVLQGKALYCQAAPIPSHEAVESARTDAPHPSAHMLARAAKLIAQSQRPLIMAGHGVILSNALYELQVFAEKTSIPVTTTLLGLSAFPDTHPLHIGMPGLHGLAHVNLAIEAADLLIGVGVRFHDYVTGDVKQFAANAQLIHIDIDPSEMHKVKAATVPIVSDAKVALAALVEEVAQGDKNPWLQEIRCWQ